MAKSPALNPASMPFFPGGQRNAPDDEANGSIFNPGFNGQRAFHGQDRSSLTSNTMSSASDYRSMRSTPSPPQQPESQNPLRQQSPSALDTDNPRHSPTFRQSDAQKAYPLVESRIVREGSMFGTLGTLPERDERSYAEEDEHVTRSGHQTPSSASYSAARQQPFQHQLPIEQSAPFLPFALSNVGRSISVSSFSSGSPVPSQESNNRVTPITGSPIQTFEAHLRVSPIIQDILDRMIRCEHVSREIQQDLSDLNRKVNILIERVVSSSQPEFKDPFAPASAPTLQPRPSISNIAPNQAATGDDVSSISQRLNTLTSSVGQLLALQTQQMQQQQQSLTSSDSRSSIIGLNHTSLEIPPNQMMPPSTASNSTILGHNLQGRPDIRQSRQQNPGSRMWSSGTVELPARPSAQEVGNKRRSSGMVRRDSAGVFDPLGDSLSGGSPRDNGPVITKWEQLNLAPELLRSLTKFGVGPPNKIQQRALPFLLKGADIIAQAPPTQERIAAYVIPAIQIAFTTMSTRQTRGPIVILVSTTLDQATQAQRMIRDLGGPIGIKSALGVGTTPVNTELAQELRLLQQNIPHIICGTPQKLHALFTTPGGLVGSDVRFLVLDEVDQLIARNLHEFVFTIVKLLPSPRSRPAAIPNSAGNSASSSASSTFTSLYEQGNPMISALQNTGRRYSTAVPSPGPPGDPSTPNSATSPSQAIERQTALFSNTVPQDVLNLATAIQLREPVRVLVRRDGNASNPDTNQSSRGLRQFYLYLAFQAGGRSEPMASSQGGLGIIGSGRSTSSAETTQAREWKLDALADLLDDVEISHAVVHVGGVTALDAVVYKLASRGFEPISLHGDMNAVTRVAALNKFRTASTILRQTNMKVLVVYDVQLKAGETPHIPLVINYDLPKAVEEYSSRVAPAIASNYSRAGVVVNFVTATGGDVEMLRSIECFYKIKCPEVPMSLRDIV